LRGGGRFRKKKVGDIRRADARRGGSVVEPISRSSGLSKVTKHGKILGGQKSLRNPKTAGPSKKRTTVKGSMRLI